MKKILLFIMTLFIIVSLFIGGSYLTYDSMVNIDTIYKGISVNGVDVSNLSKQEALDKVIREDSNRTRELKLTYGEYDFSYPYEQLGYNPNYQIAVDEAYDYARTGTPGERFLKVTELNAKPLNFEIGKSFSEENIGEIIAHLNNVISKPPVNASFSIVNGKVIITDEEDGVSVDNDKTKEAIINSIYLDEVIKVPVIKREAEIKKEAYNALKGVIGTYTTNYSSSVPNRKENIKLAASLIDGLVILPKEQVSFNNVIGEISANTGFLPATVIQDGEYETGTGGGICQVSTTLYNAAVAADLQIDERRNHSRPVNYVPLGMDAAVASGLLDLKITNQHDFPIYIKAEADNDNITFTIVGDTDKKNYDIELVSELQSYIESKQIKQDSPDLYEGESDIIQKGYTGYKYASFKIKKVNGEFVSKQPYLNSYYPARDTVIGIGTKKAE